MCLDSTFSGTSPSVGASFATVSDGAASVSAGTNDSSALIRLQDDAGIHRQIGASLQQDEPNSVGITGSEQLHSLSPDKPDACISRIYPGKLPYDLTGPNTGDVNAPLLTDQDRSSAEKTLEKRMSKLIPAADRASMIAMTTALIGGDPEALAAAVKLAGRDPQKLKALVDEIDKILEDQHCSARLDVTADGKVLVSDTNSSTALAIDPASGKIEAKTVEQNPDGSILVKPGELVHIDRDKVFSDMGDRIVRALCPNNGQFIAPHYTFPDRSQSDSPSGARRQPYYPDADHGQSSGRAPDRTGPVDSGLDPLIPEGERRSIFAIFSALKNGDEKAFADAIKRAGGDQEKLRQLLDEVNEMLKQKHSTTQLDLTADGKVLVSDCNSSTALVINPASGNIQARAVEHNSDGSILVKPGELLHVDLDKAFKDMGQTSVDAITAKETSNNVPAFPLPGHEWPPQNSFQNPSSDDHMLIH
jgi:hypothetical protein